VKCPKCGYIGFERAEKCRNCGYVFSLVEDPRNDIDLPLRRDEPLAPPADFDFSTGETPGPGAVPRALDTDFDLPSPTPAGRELPLFRPSHAPAPSPAAAVPVPSPVPVAPAAVALAPADSPQPVASPAADVPATPSRPVALPVVDMPVAPPRRVAPPAAQLSAPPPRPVAPPLAPAPAAPPVTPPRPSLSSSRRAVPAAFDFKEAEPGLEREAASAHTPSRRPGSARGVQAAGSVARAVAGMLDLLLLVGLDAAILYFTLRICHLSFADVLILPLAPLIAFLVALDGGYFVAFTAVGGQTIGKMAASLKVIGEEGGAVEPGQAVARAAGYYVSLLTAGLGFVPALFGPSRRALHDRLARTRVVRI
jgi:uncharacterized RDD family membrane protein YckC